MAIMNLTTGRMVTVDEVLDEMAAARGTAWCRGDGELDAELERAEALIETLVEERDVLQRELNATYRLLAAMEMCREHQNVTA